MQKFGGSSLANAAGIRRAAERIAKTRQAGYQVVAVVSAMGDTTDELCDLAAAVSPRPRPGDLDALVSIGELVSSALLAIALGEFSQVPRTFTGSKAGLITDNLHGKAHITDVRPDRVRACLALDEVPIVAGFQGRTKKGKKVTTLGRGGSDLTAVALAAALGAGICEIYTDVDGVYTADPRIVPTAQKIGALSSEEMLEFAASGCKVLHLRCVEYARRFGIPLHVRSSFVQEIGTLIMPGLDRHPFRKPVREQPLVSGVTSVNSASRITVAGIPANPDSLAGVFDALSHSGMNVQTIVQNTSEPGSERSDLSFTLPAHQSTSALAVLHTVQESIGFQDLQHEGPVGKVTLTGLGMRSSPEIFCTYFQALSNAGIELGLLEISETSIGAITPADRLEDAVHAVQTAFDLARAGADAPSGHATESATALGALPGGPTTAADRELTAGGTSLATALWPGEQHATATPAAQRRQAQLPEGPAAAPGTNSREGKAL